jgi:hypothetical protein
MRRRYCSDTLGRGIAVTVIVSIVSLRPDMKREGISKQKADLLLQPLSKMRVVMSPGEKDPANAD